MGEKTVILSAVIVFTVWGFRYLDEMGKEATSSPAKIGLDSLSGLSNEVLHPAQFLIAFGFIFFILSIVATGAPKLAGSFAILIAVGTTIANGVSVFNDVNKGVAGTVSLGQATEPRKTVTEHKENQVSRSHS